MKLLLALLYVSVLSLPSSWHWRKFGVVLYSAVTEAQVVEVNMRMGN
jgi:hypothetical protein